MRRVSRRSRQSSDAENPYWISFSDIMSALLLVFLLAVVAFMLQLIEKQSALAAEEAKVREQQAQFSAQIGTLREAELVRAQMLREIQKRLSSRGIEVEVTENNSVLSIPTELLGFAPGAYEIRPQYEGAALTIGSTIAEVIEEDSRYEYLETVFVEGHTDNVAATGLEGTGNWGLSTFRAISLWQLWDDQLPGSQQLDSMLRPDGTPLFSVSGYGETRPVEPVQVTDTQRAANRRIDIRFTVVRPSADDLAEIIAAFPTAESTP